MTKKQIAFLIKLITPYITMLIAGLITALYTNLHFLSSFPVDKSQVAKAITSIAVFGITAAITYISAHTKIIPDIEKWAEPIIHDLEPIAGELMSGGSTPHVSLNAHTPGTINITAGSED